MSDAPKNSIVLPLALVKPVKATQQSGLSGVIRPLRKHLPLTLLTVWDGEQYAIYLGDQHSMNYFPVKADTTVRGLLIEQIEFHVDVTTAYDAVQLIDPLGALVVKDGEAFINALPIGHNFADPVLVPVRATLEAGTKDEAIGFLHWRLLARNGDDLVELWSQRSEAVK